MNLRLRWCASIVALIALLAAVATLSLCLGAAPVPLSDIPGLLLSDHPSIEQTILLQIRLPRVLLGIAVGGALSLAGVVLQGLFRNALVEPYTLGISGGAALGVCANVLLRLGPNVGAWTVPLCGFLGALGSVCAVSLLMMRKRVVNIRDMLLIGVMISFVSSSIVMLIMAVSRTEDLQGIIFWLMGSLDESNQRLIRLAVAASLLALALGWLFCVNLNALALGDEEALHLGIPVETTKRTLFLLASLATGISVAVAGVIGFVGLVVPHLMRKIVGSDHKALIPAAWLGGATFLLFCDTIARTIIRPTELPVGVVTGILGGVLFIYTIAAANAPWRNR